MVMVMVMVPPNGSLSDCTCCVQCRPWRCNLGAPFVLDIGEGTCRLASHPRFRDGRATSGTSQGRWVGTLCGKCQEPTARCPVSTQGLPAPGPDICALGVRPCAHPFLPGPALCRCSLLIKVRGRAGGRALPWWVGFHLYDQLPWSSRGWCQVWRCQSPDWRECALRPARSQVPAIGTVPEGLLLACKGGSPRSDPRKRKVRAGVGIYHPWHLGK